MMVFLDENGRYGCVTTCPSAGMDQSMALWLRVIRTRTVTRPDCLHRLTRADLRGIREGAVRQPSVECLPVSVDMCSALHLHLFLLVVNTCTTRLL